MAVTSKLREGTLERLLAAIESDENPHPSQNQAWVGHSPRCRTVVVDDSPGYVEVVCALLSLDEMIDVVGRASDGAEAIQMVAELSPDLVLMDVHMPGMSGLNAAALLQEFFPGTLVVLMSAEELPATVSTAGCAFVRKQRFVEDFRKVLNAIW